MYSIKIRICALNTLVNPMQISWNPMQDLLAPMPSHSLFPCMTFGPVGPAYLVARYIAAVPGTALNFCPINTLLCATVLVLLGRFSVFSHILVNMLPCRGFVKKFASKSLMEQCSTFTSPFLILSVTK